MKKQFFLIFLCGYFFSANILTKDNANIYIQSEKDVIAFNVKFQKKVLSAVDLYSTKLKSVSNINEFKNWINSFEYDLNILHQEHDTFVAANDNVYIPAIDFLEAIQEEIKYLKEEEFDSIQQMSQEEFQKWLIEFKENVLNIKK